MPKKQGEMGYACAPLNASCEYTLLARTMGPGVLAPCTSPVLPQASRNTGVTSSAHMHRREVHLLGVPQKWVWGLETATCHSW